MWAKNAVRRVVAHPAQTTASRASMEASRLSRDSGPCEELLLAFRVGIASRCRRAVAVGEAASDCASPADASCRRNAAKVLDLVEPADVHLVEMPIRFQPRDRLIVCPQVEVGPAICGSRCPAAYWQQIVQKSPLGVNNSQQLEDMPRFVLLASGSPALVRDRMLQALVIRLRLRRRIC